jgi:hypothetical protein
VEVSSTKAPPRGCPTTECSRASPESTRASPQTRWVRLAHPYRHNVHHGEGNTQALVVLDGDGHVDELRAKRMEVGSEDGRRADDDTFAIDDRPYDRRGGRLWLPEAGGWGPR